MLDPTKKALTLLEEFKAFAFKGNVVDLAVAVIIGGAFGKVVDSLVKNIIMPLISLIISSEQGYQNWTLVVGDKTVPFGQFLAEFVNFLLVAFAIFLFIKKFLAWVIHVRKEEIVSPPPLTRDQELLT